MREKRRKGRFAPFFQDQKKPTDRQSKSSNDQSGSFAERHFPNFEESSAAFSFSAPLFPFSFEKKSRSSLEKNALAAFEQTFGDPIRRSKGRPIISSIKKRMTDISALANSVGGSAALMVFAVLLAFLLATLLVFTFEKTSREPVRPDHFLQSMILMAIVTATIMQAIGDSMARGLGIFGALAMLRLRLDVASPRSVAFAFAAIAVGVGCGVFGFLNTVIGTLAFCAAAFLLFLSPFNRAENLVGRLQFEAPRSSGDRKKVDQLLAFFCQKSALKDRRLFFSKEKAALAAFDFSFKMRDESQIEAFADELKKLEDLREVKLSFKNSLEPNA